MSAPTLSTYLTCYDEGGHKKLLMPPTVLSDQVSTQTYHRIGEALAEHRLPAEFEQTICKFYLPLAARLSFRVLNSSSSPSIVGVQGSQGSGKTTCSQFLKLILESEYSLSTLVLSIDDFYMSKARRQQLADSVHPLLVTRGVPGTHEVTLLSTVLHKLQRGDPIELPRFDKATDDQVSKERWERVTTRFDVVLIEGWCVGLTPEPTEQLATPINDLERLEDPDAIWRTYVNSQLSDSYQRLFERFDFQIVLQAPSFDCVFGWRLKQEGKLIERLQAEGKATADTMTPEQIRRFISHYQRLTEHALAIMPSRADWLLLLNEDHSYQRLVRSGKDA
jgi:D-glycerate 3-kinase